MVLQRNLAGGRIVLLFHRQQQCWSQSSLAARANTPRSGNERLENSMSSAKQKAAARRNVKKAAGSAKKHKSISHLSKATRTALGKQGAKVAKQRTAHG